MPDETSKTDDRAAPQLGPNSDPTGIGPPPAGSVTHVTPDGRGVTQAPMPDDEGKPGSAEASG